MTSPFFKPKVKPDCQHLRLYSQRIPDCDNPKRSHIDTYLYCAKLERKIKKHDCVDCMYYNPVTISKT